MLKTKDALAYIKANIFNTIGCTEPVAIAYAATAAYQNLGGGEVSSVDVSISVNVFKNAMAVGIPGSDKKGINFAVALGLIAGDWKKELRLFEDVSDEHLDKASAMAESGVIKTRLTDEKDKIYIYTKVKTEKGEAEAEIRGSHANLIYVKVNGRQVYGNGGPGSNQSSEATGEQNHKESAPDLKLLNDLQMEDLVQAVEGIDEDELSFLDDAVDVNIAAAEFGLKNRPGMGLGAGIKLLSQDGVVGDSLATKIETYVAAAADSRMSGMLVPIKGCGGSGNHGIAFFLGTGLAWKENQAKAVKSLRKTLAMGLLMVQYVKGYTGLLTPTCGVTVSAAPSIASSLVYAFGGTPEQMTAAVKLVIGNIAGILCDGAKHGCSLKAATSARFGAQAAFLALQGVRIPASDGIVGNDLPGTFEQFRTLQDDGLKDADKTMLDILMKKSAKM